MTREPSKTTDRLQATVAQETFDALVKVATSHRLTDDGLAAIISGVQIGSIRFLAGMMGSVSSRSEKDAGDVARAGIAVLREGLNDCLDSELEHVVSFAKRRKAQREKEESNESNTDQRH